jgi:hypothetical protein
MDSRKLFPTIDHEILKSRIRQVKEGIEFLGFVVFPDEMRLNQTAVRRQRRRIRRLRQEYAEGAIDWPKVKASLHAWNAHAAHGTAWRLRGNVFQKAVFSRLGPSQDAGTTGAEQAEALD